MNGEDCFLLPFSTLAGEASFFVIPFEVDGWTSLEAALVLGRGDLLILDGTGVTTWSFFFCSTLSLFSEVIVSSSSSWNSFTFDTIFSTSFAINSSVLVR